MESNSESQTALLDRVRDEGVDQVRVIFLDYNGLARARSVATDRLASVLSRGVNFSAPTVDFNSRDLFPPQAAFDLSTGDFWARPDASTYRPVPDEPGIGQMLADLVDAAGRPWEGCPRTALRRLVQAARDRGLSFQVGFEPEGYIFRQTGSAIEVVGLAEFATVDGLSLEPLFMRDLLHTLASLGVSVEQWSEEYGPGQIEINFHHGPALESADALVYFRQAFRDVARRHGLLGTFMPKPFGDLAGTGLHVHISASPPSDPERNLFDDPADAELGLSQLGRQSLGGLLRHGEALTALGATTVNSYKRFLPGSWAPTHVMYAAASRAAFVRVPERETARRLELRVGDPACNPYLYLAGIIAAALDGVDHELDPGPPVPGNVGALTVEEAAARGARPLPGTLEQALAHLGRDEVIRAALGPLILDEFVKIKRSEWDAFCAHVGEWDRAWYLQRY